MHHFHRTVEYYEESLRMARHQHCSYGYGKFSRLKKDRPGIPKINASTCIRTDCERDFGQYVITHIVFLQCHELTSTEPGKPLPCVIQDPVYSKLDKEFLTSLDLQVVDDPDAFDKIDSGTFVLRVGDYAHMSRWICDGVWPAAMFSNDWRTDLSRYEPSYPKGWLDPVPKMFNDYIKEPCISDKENDDTIANPKCPDAGDKDGDWDRVFLFWRKPGLISAKV